MKVALNTIKQTNKQTNVLVINAIENNFVIKNIQ
jgi:hypothetical protein